MARTYNDIYYNDDENSTAEILDDMKKLAESVDQQIGSIKSFNNDTSQFIEQVTPLMSNLSEQVIDMHQLADTMFTELEQVKEENKQLREDLNGLPKGQASGESIDLNDSAEMRCELKISGNSVQDGEPTPDEPVEVESCGDNINLFDKDNASVLKGYISGSTNTTTFATTDNSNKCIYIPCKPNKAYTVSKVSGKRFRIATTQTIASEVDINKTNNDIATKLTIISRKDDKYLIVYYYCKDDDTLTEQEILNSIKIVEGTETGEYSPYGQGCINEVICNKNLVNVGENSYSTMGLNITLDKSRIKINGTPTSNDYIFKKDNINAIYLGKFKKGTYYMTRQQFSGFTKKGNGFSLQIRKDVWNGTAVANYGMETTLQQKKVILDEDVDLYLNMWANKNDIYNNVEFLFSIYSDTDINHVQHQEQSYTIPTQRPMRAIGNVRDKFILKENGKWYERHYTYRKIFDGTENFNLGTNANSLIYFFTNAGSIKAKSQDLLCNKLTTVTNLWNETENKNLIAIRSSLDLFNIMLSDTTINTVEKFKSWLSEQYNAGTPVYVDYLLAEPLDIECTEEQSTILFDIEQNAKTYDKVTHMYSTDNVSPVIDVTYKKDIETLFANTLVEGV